MDFRCRYLPTVLTKEEMLAVIQNLPGVYQLFVQVLYGSGLRLTEGLQLRVKDVDFAQRQILVRDGKGKESRVTMLPSSLIDPLIHQLERAKAIHQQDLDRGLDSVYSPFALERKCPQVDRYSIKLAV